MNKVFFILLLLLLKAQVYTPPEFLARFCKLAQGKKFGLIRFPRICFPLGLIYCDQEPLWLLNVIELLTRCKICFTLGLFANYFSRMGGGGG